MIANVRIIWEETKTFLITIGIDQGFALSPYLLTLAMLLGTSRMKSHGLYYFQWYYFDDETWSWSLSKLEL